METVPQHLQLEKQLWSQGKQNIAGIDEAGRGPLAGPVIAAAVVFDQSTEWIDGIRDSKKLSEKKRERLYDAIIEQATAVGIGIVDSTEIDRINILRATHKAMRQAIGRLKLKVDHILVDGRGLPDNIYPQTAIIGGDRLCYSISAASIIAKVYRDRFMREMDTVFPGYGFAVHKGYGTKKHRETIQKLKPCPIHRRSFHSVKEYLVNIDTVSNTRYLGKYGEDAAAFYLYNKGFTILQRNFHAGAYGEIDIIARKNGVLSFVEVKTQRRKVYGPPANWVDDRKMQQLGIIADAYLSRHPELDLDCRFDVIGIIITSKGNRIRHMEDAFRL
ncbi:MAG: ribonuclease HII [Candidatus Marinimicrobia bacterium]|nr:ribonuclease HII [Candidatus Neomarinimicrobiota bacterium]